ncbi:MAG: AarF/ABC1/UbiB kinase family protein [Blastocatellia bacterium]|nr:AarF/ABC1/UbiB kinase family protein [Blastocatellia bacterium]MBL8196909.1 AarF/ABC1/UbiB kinase family protein [Blastocatellia bacterium]MBN8721904.1 AarF/ABC1/UbiB kinase family protein [Acidobacteriota bacterium]
MATSPRQLPAAQQNLEKLAPTTISPNNSNNLEKEPNLTLTPPAQYLPDTTIRDYGRDGWLRTFQLAYFFFIFATCLYLDNLVRQEKKDIEGFWQKLVFFLAKRFYPNRNLALEELQKKRAAWLTDKLASFGPTFIKIGQTLSTRPDIVPLEYTKELTRLQDQVPSFPQPIAWSIIEQELGAHPEKIFASIDDEPLAAASLGQVYRARLKTGEKVAVKVQRPNLAEIVNLDLAILRQTVRYLEAKHPHLTFGIEWLRIIDEFAEILFEEMDYFKEVENAEVFRKNFAKWPEIYVPEIYQELSSRRVIVEEFIDGTKVNDTHAIKAQQVEPLEVVKLISRTYLKQLLEDGFFHADPHPGNLRLMADGRLAFFDFGMVGRLTPEMQSKLVDAFFHIVERDVHGIVEDLIELKFLKEGFDPEEFREHIEEVFSHYVGMKIGQLKFQELTYAVSETIYQLPITIPPHFTFVMRALTTLEGIGILVDPNFSFFDTVKPYAKEFMLKQEGKNLRDKLLGKLVKGEDGKISWEKVWKLAKMAIKHYLVPTDQNKKQ